MAESSIITNRNFLSPLNWKFNLHRAPSVNFFLQKINMPAISLGNAPMVPNPFLSYPITPDHMQYDPLRISYKVDEDFQNYFEISNWLTSLGSPDSFTEFAKLAENPDYTGNGIYSDISVAVQNAEHETKFIINYTDAFPTSIGELNFETTDDNVKYINGSAVFRYTEYKVEKYH